MDDEKRSEIRSVNFREVCTGAIAPRWLYRSSHPITCGKKELIAELAKTAGIAAVLNLADDETVLKQKAKSIPWYNELFHKECVIALNMGFDFQAEQFSSKLNKGIKFIINHNGPYLIHCMQGIERTGFFVMLLEIVMGASINEIVGDYMTSFTDKPGFDKKSAYYRREYSNFINVLRVVNGGESVTAENIGGIAEKYVFETVGLTPSELDQLKLRLSNKHD